VTVHAWWPPSATPFPSRCASATARRLAWAGRLRTRLPAGLLGDGCRCLIGNDSQNGRLTSLLFGIESVPALAFSPLFAPLCFLVSFPRSFGARALKLSFLFRATGDLKSLTFSDALLSHRSLSCAMPDIPLKRESLTVKSLLRVPGMTTVNVRYEFAHGGSIGD
jgi:hypothetical protein